MPTNHCLNCDRAIKPGKRYCSDLCRDIDAHPAPRDDMEQMTKPHTLTCDEIEAMSIRARALAAMPSPPKCPLCLDRGGMDPCPECGKETAEPALFEENCTFVLGRWSIEAVMPTDTTDDEAQATLAHLSPLIERLLEAVVASMVKPNNVTFRVDW